MNKNRIVYEYKEKKNHPLAQEIEGVREIILNTHENIALEWIRIQDENS